MDIFYQSLDIDQSLKKKLHYNEFMLQIHQEEHAMNKKLKGKHGDTSTIIGNLFAQDLVFFAIDEF